MSIPRAQPGAETCPNCNSAVNRGALVCGSCGGIIPFERGAKRVKDHLVAVLLSQRAAFDNRARLIWLLALTPILIGPPLLALFILFMGRGEKKKPSDPALAATIAAVNVILSVIAWHWLGDRVYGAGSGLWRLIVPLGMGHSPMVKQIPI
jgi:predicted nucleic acid-binding Zn ribbon protein